MFKIPSEVTIKKLQYFLTAAEELHFGHAAEKLGISQPSLSSHIKELEQIFDTELFNRSSRHIALTETGKILKNECYSILVHVESSINKVTQSSRKAHNTINIGVISAALTNDFMLIIEGFKKRFPCYLVNFIELPPTEQKAAISNNEIDIGICRFADTINILPLSAVSVVKENMQLAVSGSHHFSRRKLVSIKELEGEPLVIMNKKRSASPDYIINNMIQNGFNPTINNEVIDPSTLLAFVSASQSISVVPESFSNIKFGNVKMIGLKEKISSDICAIFSSSLRNPILTELVEFMSNAKNVR